MAVVVEIEYLTTELTATFFRITIDYNAFIILITNNNLVGRRKRYRNSQARLDFTIKHIKSKANNIADQLSRQYKEGNIYPLSEHLLEISDITKLVKHYIYLAAT